MFDMRLDPEGNLLPGKTWDDSPGLPPAETEMLLAMLDMPVTIDRCFVEICGDMAAAAILTELSTIETQTRRKDQWFPVAEDEFSHHLALSPKQQAAARRLLRAQGLIEHRRKGTPPRDEFRVLWPAILMLLRQKAAERTAHIVWPPRRADRELP